MTKILTKYWDQIDPRDIQSYRKKGGYKALYKAIRMSPAEVISEITNSGLAGRGGAGFSTGGKWEIAAKQEEKERYFICNLDESEPGTFKDRMIAEKNPHSLLEGIAIGSYAIGAKRAFIYINGNFVLARTTLEYAIEQANKDNFLGKGIMGSLFDLDVTAISGAGAYICGEESALINSIEGKRGEPREKPPFACECGLFGKPTVVNNAETIANVEWILKKGAQEYKKIGTKGNAGTKLFCIDGSVKAPGIYEVPLGSTVKELIYDFAGGMTNGTDFWFAQVGGSAGHLVPVGLIDEAPGYGKNMKIPLGSGSILVVDKSRDIKKLMLSWIRFFQRESCGKCVPCREGTFRLKSVIERLENGNFNENDREDFHKLVWVLDNTTFCPLGKFSVTAIKDVVKYKYIKELS